MQSPFNNILIAEDDPVSCRLLQATLERHGYKVIVTRDGTEATAKLNEINGPILAVLDWMMPGVSGVDICRAVLERKLSQPPYFIMLTAKGSRDDKVDALNSGANDFVTKPFDGEELIARVRVGIRVLELQSNLAARVRELEEAMANIKVLQGLLPICTYCKKIRDDQNYWQQVEGYVAKHTSARFSHGICPDCYEKIIRPQLEQLDDLDSGSKT